MRDALGRFVKGHAPLGGAPAGVRSSPKTEFKKGSVPWNKQAVNELRCAYCGNVFHVANWEMRRRDGKPRKFCSKECVHKGADYKATFQAGEKHPAWVDGASLDGYPHEFNSKLKQRIKERDGFVCRLCGVTERDYLAKVGKPLCVNHIDFNKTNCDERNLNTLCLGCNSHINWNRAHWTAHFQKQMEAAK